MEFTHPTLFQAPDWSSTVSEVSRSFKTGHWIFRALESPDEGSIVYQGSADATIFRSVRIPVLSSFDKAWQSRSWSVEAMRWRYEALMLREFKRGAYLYRATVPQPHQFLEWLSLARQYEMPARLLDFSYSFFVAAYFALSGKNHRRHGFILALDLDTLTRKTSRKMPDWKLSATGPDLDFHNPTVFREYAFEKKPLWVVAVTPIRGNERLFNQQGLFLCPGNIEKTFEENLAATLSEGAQYRLICLPATHRTPGIVDLKRMNVDLRMLYPDLSGFAQSIRDSVHTDIDESDEDLIREITRTISDNPWH